MYTDKVGDTAEKGLGARVVKDLTSNLRGKYHHAFFDNFFTSVDLLVDLEKEGVYACGTARKDRRGFPTALKKPSLPNRLVNGSIDRICIWVYHTYTHTHVNT